MEGRSWENNIFSIWDRLFGTYAKVDNMAEIRYGIDTHMEPAQNTSLKTLLKTPFGKFDKTPSKQIKT